jgi:hypothetical protein
MNMGDKDKYIKQLEDKIVTLEARIQKLEHLLGNFKGSGANNPISVKTILLNPRPAVQSMFYS